MEDICSFYRRSVDPGQKAVPWLLHTALLQPDRPEKLQFNFSSAFIPTFDKSPQASRRAEQSPSLLLSAWLPGYSVSLRILLIKVRLQFDDLKTLICHLATEILSKKRMFCQVPALAKLHRDSCPQENSMIYKFFASIHKHTKCKLKFSS